MGEFSKIQADDIWLDKYNKNVSEISEVYQEDALLYTGKGNLITGSSAVAEYYASLHKEIPAILSINETYSQKVRDNMVFTMGEMDLGQHYPYKYVRIWEEVGEVWKIRLEAVCKITFDQKDVSAFDAVRKEWVRLSNKHDHSKLIRNLYSEDSVYFDQVKVYRGWIGIESVYGYMNDPGFNIDLFGKSVCPVQPDLTFEIGMYNANGHEGGYIIIWEKQESGEWKIALDSNS